MSNNSSQDTTQAAVGATEPQRVEEIKTPNTTTEDIAAADDEDDDESANDPEALTGADEQLAADQSRRSQAKIAQSPEFARECGYYGEVADSGQKQYSGGAAATPDPTADTSNFTASRTPETDPVYRRKGHTLEQEERTIGQEEEAERLTKRAVRKRVDKVAKDQDLEIRPEVSENEGRLTAEECREEIIEETRDRGLWVGEPEYKTKQRNIDPREMVSQEVLGEINRFAKKIHTEIGFESRANISKRIAWKVADPIKLDGAIPINYAERPLDPYAPAVDDLTAAEKVRDEMLYEYPTTLEGVNPDHKKANIKVTVTDMFNPNNPKQKQVFNAKDDDGKVCKVTIWKKSDGDKNGPQGIPALGICDWNLNTRLPAISEGDEIIIEGASPSRYRDIVNITATTDTTITILENGDGDCVVNTPPIDENSGPSDELREQMQSTQRADYVVPRSIDEEEDKDVAKLHEKRHRPRTVVLARHGDISPEEAPDHPSKDDDPLGTGWRFCNTWVFRKSSVPDWKLEQNNIEDVNRDKIGI